MCLTPQALRALLRRARLALVLLAGLALGGCPSGGGASSVAATTAGESSTAPSRVEPEQLAVAVVEVHPHDPGSYTQGLVYHEGVVYESSGGYGRSGARRYALGSAEPDLLHPLDASLFGEGFELVNGELQQLTWKEGLMFSYSLESFEPTGQRRYRGEGWGLAYDGERLVSSDGTHVLSIRDPESLEVLEKRVVKRRGVNQDNLNELEFVGGALYANVYQTDEIVRIDLASGAVTAVIDASGLLAPEEERRAEVLNGIAYRPETDTFLLTGKYWPKLFEVRFVPRSAASP